MVPALVCCAEVAEIPSPDLPATGDPSSAAGSYSPAESAELPPSWSGDLRTRSQWTGSWWGARDAFADNGLTFFGDLTQYYQGIAAGGLRQQFRYGFRGDYLIDLDTQKMGLWEGGHLDLRGESRLGQDTNRIDGALALSNFGMALPLPRPSVTALTGVQYSQTLSDHCSVFAGKLNLLDGAPGAYAQGRRLNYFWNAGMQSNLSRIYLIPSTLGGGLTIRNDVEPVFNLFLLDTHFTPTTSGFSALFSNGLVAYGEYRVRTNWFELPGHSALGFLYSTAKRTLGESTPYLAIPENLSASEIKPSAWTVTYRFDQVLYVDSEDPQRRWTLNSDWGVTDGNPNPIRWFANFSLVGNSPFLERENDTVGIGYYHLGVSDRSFLTSLGFEAENGIELFYNAAVTPWFHLTPDLQILDPSRRSNETALLIGVRGQISF